MSFCLSDQMDALLYNTECDITKSQEHLADLLKTLTLFNFYSKKFRSDKKTYFLTLKNMCIIAMSELSRLRESLPIIEMDIDRVLEKIDHRDIQKEGDKNGYE